ncbi:MAG: PaaI family thioesterase, partial [Candidatus Dormibacteraeota bacterium]|nr:PaaI family thioesterase [Candidatus Dormibacteraeota bacterium]
MGMQHSDIQREPPRGFAMDPRLFLTRPGLDMMRTFQEGFSLPPPVHYLYGLSPTHAGPGSSTFTMPASPWLLPPQGIISGATLALLVDGPLGSAVQTGLAAATPYTTAELSMTFVRPVLADGRPLTGTARLLHAGRSVGISEVAVTTAGGELVAVGSTRCAIMAPIDVPPGVAEELEANPPRQVEPAWGSPHPYLRPVAGEVLGQATWDRFSGLEILQRLVAGDLPAPPISRLLGIFPENAAEGESTWTMP